MIKKNDRLHGLIVGLVSGIGLGFLFSSWIAAWIGGPHANWLPYVTGFMVCGLLATIINHFFRLRGDSVRESSTDAPAGSD